MLRRNRAPGEIRAGNPFLAKNSQHIMVAGAGAGRDGGVAVPRVSQVLPWIAAAALSAAALPVHAQSNLDAGKSAAQIFSATCNACHRSPRELKQSSAGFLREHYTTGPREAAAMAAYLSAIGSDPRAVQQRRPPTLGAGQTGAPTDNAARGAEQGKPSETQAALPAATPGRRATGTADPTQPSPGPVAGGIKPRRPSESMEAGKLPLEGSVAEMAPQAAIAAPARPSTAEDFEE